MNRGLAITEETIEAVERFWLAGVPYRVIAFLVGIGHMTAWRIVNRVGRRKRFRETLP
jgi:DNA invertase Pin-like site-specific DNA recombinase